MKYTQRSVAGKTFLLKWQTSSDAPVRKHTDVGVRPLAAAQLVFQGKYSKEHTQEAAAAVGQTHKGDVFTVSGSLGFFMVYC